MRTIEIDFDVHKLIENEREGFEESENTALRRLLGLPSLISDDGHGHVTDIPSAPWRGKNVTLPHKTKLRMSYNGRAYEVRIEDGKWVAGEQSFSSPSGAASGLATTKKGKKTRLDGWNYWEAKIPGSSEWRSIAEMFREANPGAEISLADIDL